MIVTGQDWTVDIPSFIAFFGVGWLDVIGERARVVLRQGAIGEQRAMDQLEGWTGRVA